MEIFKKIKLILLEPTKFFANLKKEKGIKEAFKYFLVLSFVNTFLGVFSQLTFQKYYFELINSMYGGIFTIPPQNIYTLFIFPLIWFVFGLFLSFVIAGILHVWILIFGGKGNYSKTYQLWVYSITPGLIFGWIPILGFFALIYELFLLILGTQKIHAVERKKAILMYVIPAILLLVLMFFFMAFMISTIRSNPEIFANYTST